MASKETCGINLKDKFLQTFKITSLIGNTLAISLRHKRTFVLSQTI